MNLWTPFELLRNDGVELSARNGFTKYKLGYFDFKAISLRCNYFEKFFFLVAYMLLIPMYYICFCSFYEKTSPNIICIRF